MVLAIPTDTIALRRTRVTPCDVLTVAESAQAVGPILGVVRRPAGEGCGGKAEREVREQVPVGKGKVETANFATGRCGVDPPGRCGGVGLLVRPIAPSTFGTPAGRGPQVVVAAGAAAPFQPPQQNGPPMPSRPPQQVDDAP